MRKSLVLLNSFNLTVLLTLVVSIVTLTALRTEQIPIWLFSLNIVFAFILLAAFFISLIKYLRNETLTKKRWWYFIGYIFLPLGITLLIIEKQKKNTENSNNSDDYSKATTATLWLLIAAGIHNLVWIIVFAFMKEIAIVLVLTFLTLFLLISFLGILGGLLFKRHLLIVCFAGFGILISWPLWFISIQSTKNKLF
ncbi:hypothetical protein SSABA_v1c08680 [Spiroplasma sabaudiense Ar-1343]|uniref:Transmembrane protein n=1 Tax=Spiroplasma sabaudiense Ar-1343 TaxID=1276257 RepID=W6AB49_9MOLU|nr:hypothetical protein [Spiroplasma sabaudiense]AHI54267.1 hypothetical protein SSABA_v1c08680 [Spiroplasma sabaudiense Ar-1343]